MLFKGADSQYLGLCGTYGVSSKYSTLPHCKKKTIDNEIGMVVVQQISSQRRLTWLVVTTGETTTGQSGSFQATSLLCLNKPCCVLFKKDILKKKSSIYIVSNYY